MQTKTLPSYNPLSVSLGPPHHHALRNPDHRGTSLPGNYDHRPAGLGSSELSSSSAAPPPGTELSTIDYDSDEETVNQVRPLPKGPVNNFSGKYSRDEILALHRLDYPVPTNFTLEEDITSGIALEPVASSKFTRKPMEGSLREGSNFFLPKSTKGRGRGRRYMDEHGLNYSAPIDPRSMIAQSEPSFGPHHISSANQSAIHAVNPTVPPPASLHSSSHHPLNISSGTLQTSHGATSTHHYNSSSYASYLLGEDFILDDEKWFYKDPKGQERGPFGSMQMDKWVKFDFFKVDLMVRRENSEYVYLGDIFFSEGRNPFTGEPLDQWFTGPTSEFKISLMLLIQNYHINRMKQEQPFPQQVEYTINNPGEPNTASSTDPYQPYNIAPTQTTGNSASTVTYTFTNENLIDAKDKDPHPVEIKNEDIAPKNVSRHDKQPAADITRPIHWYSTSEPSSTSSSFYNQSNPPQNQANPATIPPKDWSTLQQEQTQKIQEIVAQMTKPKKSKKKKGKKANQTGKPAQNASNPVQKKPNELDNTKPIVANNPSSQKTNNTNTQNSHTNTQKNTNQVEVKNKPQTPPQPQQPQSINKKPKPQYKVKEPTPSESEPEPEIKPNDNNASSANQSQFPKRQNIRPPKVWKRKDEDENDEQLNN